MASTRQEGGSPRGGDAVCEAGRGGCTRGLALGGILVGKKTALNLDNGGGETTHQRKMEKVYLK